MKQLENKKVLAAVVTHNRCDLLKRCIEGLTNQTYKPDILVIDNASSDDTKKYLLNSSIDHITQENLGSAGGWEKALSEGWARNYNFIWLMDDDGFPDRSALEVLVNAVEKDMICISSIVVKEDNHDELVFGLPRINKNGLPIIFSATRKYNFLKSIPAGIEKYPHAHLFNGALINLKLAKNIGNIDRNYFMYGDEVDYNYRMKKAGKVFTATKALHYHPDVSKRSLENKKVYYFIRNTIILNHKYFDVPVLRDFLNIAVVLYRIAARNGIVEFFKYLMGSKSKYLYHGIKDGFKQYRPVRF
jgi:rhamnopyranosyl-N-acetylglucosaminyl-diphospho-decaprenol beta-1,3/1,4-galactofuranosyltransferase